MARSKGSKQISIERRQFLKRGALAGAAALAAPVGMAGAALAQAAAPPPPLPPRPPLFSAGPETATPPEVEVLTTDRSGSDFMVDVIKSLGFEYVCANPGSSFRGLHESIINYGGNQSPEFITCCHEESSVAMAHGYFKVEGKPLAVMAHGTVGLQHASMAIYNAWCDRVPVYIFIGNYGDATLRRPLEWYHGVQDAAAMVRDYTKWDDAPWSLTHFAESAVRAYKIAMTPPMAPVVLVARRRASRGAARLRRRAADPEAHRAGAAAGRLGGRGRAGAAARRRREPAARRRPARADAGWHGASHGRACRNAAGRRDRPGRAHEFPVAPSAQSDLARECGHRRRRRDPGPRSHRLLDERQRVARPADPLVPADREAGSEDDQHHDRRSVHQGELPGLPALCRRSTWRLPPTPKPRCRR